jgi:hypothetical protein
MTGAESSRAVEPEAAAVGDVLSEVETAAVVVDIIYQGETICRTALHYRLVVMRGVTL